MACCSNLFFGGAKPLPGDTLKPGNDPVTPDFRLEENDEGVFLVTNFRLSDLNNRKGKIVDSQRLGTTRLSGYRFEHRNGSPFVLDTDYFGRARHAAAPTIGPVETLPSDQRIQVWSGL